MVKYFSSPLCLKLRIMPSSVTHPVTGYNLNCRLTPRISGQTRSVASGLVRLHAFVRRQGHDFTRVEYQPLRKNGIPPQSMTSGIHENFQLSLIGKIAIPIAAKIPPKIGAIEDASSFRTMVSQKINPLYAMKALPIINNVIANVICGQITKTISQVIVASSRSQSRALNESLLVIVLPPNV